MDGASGAVGAWMEERTIGMGNPNDDFMTFFVHFLLIPLFLTNVEGSGVFTGHVALLVTNNDMTIKCSRSRVN